MKIYAHFLKEKKQDSNGSLMRVSRDGDVQPLDECQAQIGTD